MDILYDGWPCETWRRCVNKRCSTPSINRHWQQHVRIFIRYILRVPYTHTHTLLHLQYLYSINTGTPTQTYKCKHCARCNTHTHTSAKLPCTLLHHCNTLLLRCLCGRTQQWEINLVQQSMKVLSFPRVTRSYGLTSTANLMWKSPHCRCSMDYLSLWHAKEWWLLHMSCYI